MPPLLNPDTPVHAKQVPAPSKRLTDAANTATPKLSTHLEAVNLKRAEDARHLAEDARQASAPPTTVPATSHSVSSSSEEDSDHSAAPKRPQSKQYYIDSPLILLKVLSHSKKVSYSSSHYFRLRRCACCTTVFSDADPINDEGFLLNVDVMSLSSNKIKPKHDRKGQDIDKFLSSKYSEIGVDGKPRVYCDCTLCSKKGPRKHFVKDLSTCHQHLQKDHEVRSVFVILNAHDTN